jgi:hypothetical protein
MSWHEKLDRLAAEFLEETDAILGAEEGKAERLRYAQEIMQAVCALSDRVFVIYSALWVDSK